MIKVKKITIKDFKAIAKLDKDIAGANIILSGENGVGKSSVMQMIEIAFGKTTNIPPNATGEGQIIVDKDGNEYTFYVKFKDGKPLLKVTTPDGLSDDRKGSIAKIIGAVNFDINLFLEQSKSEKGRKEQIELFKSLLDPQVKEMIETLEANVKVNYTERTEINRKLKEVSVGIETHPLNGQNLEDFKPVDLKIVYSELQKANETNERINGVIIRQEERERAIETLDKSIIDLENRLRALKTEHTVQIEKRLEAAEWLGKNKPVDIAAFEKEIQDATQTNNQYNSAQELIKLLVEKDELTELSGTKTANIESQRFEIQNAIKEMGNPVPGLEYNDEGLVYEGIPVSVDSLAFSKIRELGVKMRIAENPNIPLFISNGESIGNVILKELIDIADNLGLQIFMEQFERGQESLELEIMADKLSLPSKANTK